MIPVEEALEKILASVNVLEPEIKPIMECLGQVLAENVYSDVTIPPLDNSAMDGYAVRWESIKDASDQNAESTKQLEIQAQSLKELGQSLKELAGGLGSNWESA